MRNYRLKSLQKFGITPLTGEACQLSMRQLCDLTDEGVQHVRNFFGGTVEITTRTEWNEGTASILLSWSTLFDLLIFIVWQTAEAPWMLIDDRRREIILLTREQWEHYNEGDPIISYRSMWTSQGESNATGRNVHQMSGRVV